MFLLRSVSSATLPNRIDLATSRTPMTPFRSQRSLFSASDWTLVARATANATAAVRLLDQAVDHSPLAAAWTIRTVFDQARRRAQLAGQPVAEERFLAFCNGLAVSPAWPTDGPALIDAATDLRRLLRLYDPTHIAHRLAPSVTAPPETLQPGVSSARARAAATPHTYPEVIRLALALRSHLNGERSLLDGLAAIGHILADLQLTRVARPCYTAIQVPSLATPFPLWTLAVLNEITRAADTARRRLDALTHAWRRWHNAIATRQANSRADRVLDLALALPGISANAVVTTFAMLSAASIPWHANMPNTGRAGGITPAGANHILRHLAAAGVLRGVITRSNWKLYVPVDQPLTPTDILHTRATRSATRTRPSRRRPDQPTEDTTVHVSAWPPLTAEDLRTMRSTPLPSEATLQASIDAVNACIASSTAILARYGHSGRQIPNEAPAPSAGNRRAS